MREDCDFSLLCSQFLAAKKANTWRLKSSNGLKYYMFVYLHIVHESIFYKGLFVNWPK